MCLKVLAKNIKQYNKGKLSNNINKELITKKSPEKIIINKLKNKAIKIKKL